MITIRYAVPNDVPGIMEVEQATFGTVGDEATASRTVMAKRIDLLNAAQNKWFLVAQDEDGGIVGDMILQPTNLVPDRCTSWDVATDHGTLLTTFDALGTNIYVVSLAVSPRAAMDAVGTLLMHASLAVWAWHHGLFMFCSRMPGFARAREKSGIGPQDYLNLKHRDGGPRDPMLRLYWKMSGGVWPYRLLENGFPPDAESGGHGALFALEDPVRALFATGTFLAGGTAATKKED
jgi:hypothetical protein